MQLSMVNQGNGPKRKTANGNHHRQYRHSNQHRPINLRRIEKEGGRFYSDAHLRDICVDAVNVLRSGVWWCLFQEKWRMARHKKKQWMKSKNNKLMVDSNSALNPVTEHWLDTTTCEIKIQFSVTLPFPLTEQKRASVAPAIADWWYFQRAATSLKLIYCRDYWLLWFHMKGSRLNMEPQLHPLALFNFQTHFQLSVNPLPLFRHTVKEFSSIYSCLIS